MKSTSSDWYKKGWTLDIKNHPWVEDTINQVDFIIKQLDLKGGERILDLACGYGRHSLELAKRGFEVVGIDITSEYVNDANKNAVEQNLNAKFICSDIRDVSFENEFDAVLNLADGAIGYLENDNENHKIFETISNALKPGGKSFMDIMNAEYADCHFPIQLWDSGENGLTLSKFEWDKETRIMLYGQQDYHYGKPIEKPIFNHGYPTRLYNIDEIKSIMKKINMDVIKSYCDYYGNLSSENRIQLMVCSIKL